MRRQSNILPHHFAAAVAAIAAIVPGAFAKVVEQIGAETAGGFAVGCHLIQALQIPLPDKPLLSCGKGHVFLGILDEELGRLDIPVGKEQAAMGLFPVPPGAARLLVVAFDIFRHMVMQHKADIGFVDPHAKGIGDHHDPGPVIDEVLLVLFPFPIREPGMIAGGGDLALPQVIANRFHRFPGGAVDNTALPRPGRQKGAQIGVLAFGARHLKIEIGPVKAGGDRERVLQRQQLFNISFHRGGGGGGESADRRALGKGSDKPGDFQIAGTEILPPLGNAMSLVHCQQGDSRFPGEAEKIRGRQPLRRHIDDFISPVFSAAKHLPVLLCREGGIEIGGGDPGLAERGHLILHQGNQGRNNQGQPRQQQGGQLIANRLARPGGHDPQRIPAGQQRLNQRLLPRPKPAVAKIPLEQRGFSDDEHRPSLI